MKEGTTLQIQDNALRYMLDISIILGEYVNKAYGIYTIKTAYRKCALESLLSYELKQEPWVNIYSMTFHWSQLTAALGQGVDLLVFM